MFGSSFSENSEYAFGDSDRFDDTISSKKIGYLYISLKNRYFHV